MNEYDIYNNLILVKGDEACERCAGTGNELAFHYRQCTSCGGDGRRHDMMSPAEFLADSEEAITDKTPDPLENWSKSGDDYGD